MKWICE